MTDVENYLWQVDKQSVCVCQEDSEELEAHAGLGLVNKILFLICKQRMNNSSPKYGEHIADCWHLSENDICVF